MAKTRIFLLSLAAAGVSIPALAQSNVTVYGRLNTSFEQTKVEGGPNISQLVNNNSRLGFRGSEDLGGGLSAVFQIENAVNSDAPGGTWAGRDSWVGLQGNLGAVKLGNITSPLYYATHDYVGMHNHDTGNSADAFIWVPAYDPDNFRARNSISYASPKLGGFTFEAHYSLVSEQAAATATRNAKPAHWSATGSYDNGPLHAGLGFAQTKKFYNFAQGESKDSAAVLAVTYDLKSVVLAGLFERDKSENGGLQNATTLTGSHTRNHYRFAVMVPFGANELHLNYGVARDWSGTSDTGAKQTTLAYNYNLSKRTKVYAQWTKINNDSVQVSVAGGGAYNGGGAYSFLGSAAGLDNTSTGCWSSP